MTFLSPRASCLSVSHMTWRRQPVVFLESVVDILTFFKASDVEDKVNVKPVYSGATCLSLNPIFAHLCSLHNQGQVT